eukprot:825216-Amphidinium_carterae.2
MAEDAELPERPSAESGSGNNDPDAEAVERAGSENGDEQPDVEVSRADANHDGEEKDIAKQNSQWSKQNSMPCRSNRVVFSHAGVLQSTCDRAPASREENVPADVHSAAAVEEQGAEPKKKKNRETGKREQSESDSESRSPVPTEIASPVKRQNAESVDLVSPVHKKKTLLLAMQLVKAPFAYDTASYWLLAAWPCRLGVVSQCESLCAVDCERIKQHLGGGMKLHSSELSLELVLQFASHSYSVVSEMGTGT